VRKVVAENLNEYWTSTDTGAGLYTDYSPTQQRGPESENQEDFSEMVPPPNMKLTPEDFDDYVTQLIDFIPQSPVMAVKIFKVVLTTHPYLRRKPIGFKSNNPYEPTINKFLTAVKMLTER
jgi:hypothetical protein